MSQVQRVGRVCEKKQFNERGYRIGQYHHRAKLSDHDVSLIFQLRDEGATLEKIAHYMDCGKTTIWKILNGYIRGQAIAKEFVLHKV